MNLLGLYCRCRCHSLFETLHWCDWQTCIKSPCCQWAVKQTKTNKSLKFTLILNWTVNNSCSSCLCFLEGRPLKILVLKVETCVNKSSGRLLLWVTHNPVGLLSVVVCVHHLLSGYIALSAIQPPGKMYKVFIWTVDMLVDTGLERNWLQ